MATTGAKHGATVTGNTGSGGTWAATSGTLVTAIQSTDAVFDAANVTGGVSNTRVLKITNLDGTAVPGTATSVDQFALTLKAKCSANSAAHLSGQTVKAGTATGATKTTTSASLTTSVSTFTLSGVVGAAYWNWSPAPTVSDTTNSGFGFQVLGIDDTGADSNTVSIDEAYMDITYTPAGGTFINPGMRSGGMMSGGIRTGGRLSPHQCFVRLRPLIEFPIRFIVGPGFCELWRPKSMILIPRSFKIAA